MSENSSEKSGSNSAKSVNNLLSYSLVYLVSTPLLVNQQWVTLAHKSETQENSRATQLLGSKEDLLESQLGLLVATIRATCLERTSKTEF